MRNRNSERLLLSSLQTTPNRCLEQYFKGCICLHCSAAYVKAIGDEMLTQRHYLVNPMSFDGDAAHFRIRVGACDVDTAFTISMALALKLAAAGKSVDYAQSGTVPTVKLIIPAKSVIGSSALLRNECR